jgi:hypothetical protein
VQLCWAWVPAIIPTQPTKRHQCGLVSKRLWRLSDPVSLQVICSSKFQPPPRRCLIHVIHSIPECSLGSLISRYSMSCWLASILPCRECSDFSSGLQHHYVGFAAVEGQHSKFDQSTSSHSSQFGQLCSRTIERFSTPATEGC